MSIFFNYNGNIYKEGTPVVTPDNRSFRYGDGLFETMKVENGEIQLSDYHFERLFSGMETLQFKIPNHFTPHYLREKINGLCEKNQHTSLTRVRLMIFRGNGGLYDPENHHPNYIIQSWKLEPGLEINSNGLIIDVYSGAQKSCDTLANLKNNNFLPYAMAAMYAKEIKVNDCILLNNYGRICDTTIANIFILKDGILYTPPLSEGCVAGVMRRYIIKKLTASYTIMEEPLSIEQLQNADEVFLTNVIRGIRWVKQFREIRYPGAFVKEIDAMIKKL